jgi:AcrR family transcriptional regulator
MYTKRKDLELAPSRLRARIIDAAIAVFARHGFATTRVEDILREAGVARRTFYRHFDNKEQVLAAIFEFAGNELVRAMRATLASGADPLDAVRRTLDVYLDYHLANPTLLGTLVRQALDPTSPLAPLRRRLRGELVELIGASVRAATGEHNDPLLYGVLLSAVEATSLELVAAPVSDRVITRTRKVMHTILDRIFVSPRG